MFESQDTRRARYGGFGPCVAAGRCDTCPISQHQASRRLDSFTDRVLFRVNGPDGLPWALNRPEDGWASYGEPWQWDQLAAIPGWRFDGIHHDEHGEGLWLRRAEERAGQ